MVEVPNQGLHVEEENVLTWSNKLNFLVPPEEELTRIDPATQQTYKNLDAFLCALCNSLSNPVVCCGFSDSNDDECGIMVCKGCSAKNLAGENKLCRGSGAPHQFHEKKLIKALKITLDASVFTCPNIDCQKPVGYNETRSHRETCLNKSFRCLLKCGNG